jgi:hypothetical protein
MTMGSAGNDMTTATLSSFNSVARDFCAWCEAGINRQYAAKQAALWLARLHAAALELPGAEPDHAQDWPDIPPPQLALAEANLSMFKGWYYRTVFDPDPNNAEVPVIGDVGDDLLDTYLDVKRGLLLAELGSARDRRTVRPACPNAV